MTANPCDPLTIPRMKNAKEHSCLFLEVLINQDKQTKRAKYTQMCKPTLIAIELVIHVVGFICNNPSIDTSG